MKKIKWIRSRVNIITMKWSFQRIGYMNITIICIFTYLYYWWSLENPEGIFSSFYETFMYIVYVIYMHVILYIHIYISIPYHLLMHYINTYKAILYSYQVMLIIRSTLCACVIHARCSENHLESSFTINRMYTLYYITALHILCWEC